MVANIQETMEKRWLSKPYTNQLTKSSISTPPCVNIGVLDVHTS